ncbi:MAG: glycosyltransferase family 2 protein [Acidaminococcaceae bacterium]|nr:glycosyltransferase family 2 protein [Acidaminococcaceae bacterium]
MTELLYSIKLPRNKSTEKLYIKAEGLKYCTNCVAVNKKGCLDLGTYFNLFSLKKWLKFTSILSWKINLTIEGEYNVSIYSIKKDDCTTILFNTHGVNNFFHEFNTETLQKWAEEKNEILGIKIESCTPILKFYGGAYYADFAAGKDVNIGITICTFKREAYLKKNIEILKQYCADNTYCNVMVIDNGRTLDLQEENNFKIIPNLNYGGSGGFTRGLIEQVRMKRNSHVLLMDDDIELEVSSLQRLYAFVSHLKDDYNNRLIAGSMLRMDQPTIQHENSAYWGKIRIRTLGKNFDLTQTRCLYENENLPLHKNKYAAWWFCCIPLNVIKKIGYPLPIFIKGDDMEYGIRNALDVITLNGIGVWHEPFTHKVNPVVNYYSDRNMLIVNQYADGGSRWYFAALLLVRLIRRMLERKLIGIQLYEKAIKDYADGLFKITETGSDEILIQIQNYKTEKGLFRILFNILAVGIKEFLYYNKRHKDYIKFREKNLSDATFWTKFLKLKNPNIVEK